MSWPAPQPGLVIRYAYLWRREALAGREEGTKDRPCAVVLAHQDAGGEMRVYVLPVTHSPPGADDEAVEIPAPVKRRLGLDAGRSWIVVSEANIFSPGRGRTCALCRGPESAAYGFLPPALFQLVRDRFLARARRRRAALVARTEGRDRFRPSSAASIQLPPSISLHPAAEAIVRRLPATSTSTSTRCRSRSLILIQPKLDLPARVRGRGE